MVKFSPILKGVEKKIPRLFEKLKIEPVKREDILEKIGKGMGRFYYTVCKDKSGKKYFLKVRVMKSLEVSRQLKQEIAVYRFLKNISKKVALNFLFPSILKKGKFQGLDWYLRDFKEGKLAGNMREDLGYRNFFLKDCSPEKFAKAIASLQEIPKNFLKNLKIYKHGGFWYSQDFEHYKRTFFKFFLKSPFNQNLLTKKEVRKAGEIIEKNKKILDENASFLTHGDLYPNNIIITEDKKILLLDWELFHLNNRFFDPSFVWFLSHRNKNWQKKFFNLTMGKWPDEKIFQIVLISLSTRFASACWQNLRKMKKIYSLSEAMKSFEFSLLRHYLKILKKLTQNENSIFNS